MLLAKVWRFQTVHLASVRAPGRLHRSCSSRPKNEETSQRDHAANESPAIDEQYPGGSNFRRSFAVIRSSFGSSAHHTGNSPPNRNSSSNSHDQANFDAKKSFLSPNALVCGSILALLIYELNAEQVNAKEVNQDELAKEYGKFDKRLKTITIEELNKHNCKENGIWVSFREGVYDVTGFVEQHPGGNIILMAAGDLKKILDYQISYN